jgi:hypothetical protein
MINYEWDKDASCKGYDTELFFDKYEEDLQLRPAIDALCAECPIARECFARGVSNKGTGVWGGIYIDNGKISREFNRHRSKQQWANTWKYLTNDVS